MKIFYAGDSTCARYSIVKFPQTGIGQGLELYIKPEVRIENHAVGGRSSKSFIDEGRLKAIENEIQEGDFLFIQFGHNDEKRNDERRYTTPFGTYKEYLRQYIRVARKASAVPVLITPVERRCFVDACTLGESTLTEYAAGMKQVADEERVLLIDLNLKSRAKMEEAGAVETTKWFMHLAKGEYLPYPQGKVDDTHLKPDGARIFAGLVAEGLREAGGIYSELLVDGFVFDGTMKSQ